MKPVRTKSAANPPRTKPGQIFIGLQLPNTLAEVLKSDAVKNYRNLSAHIRMILEKYYEQNN